VFFHTAQTIEMQTNKILSAFLPTVKHTTYIKKHQNFGKKFFFLFSTLPLMTWWKAVLMNCSRKNTMQAFVF